MSLHSVPKHRNTKQPKIRVENSGSERLAIVLRGLAAILDDISKANDFDNEDVHDLGHIANTMRRIAPRIVGLERDYKNDTGNSNGSTT